MTHPRQDCPRLIEVALPIREVSAESVRDKNIHHAHISHLHQWWARRPLSASRAVVFASLIPDPDDARCPQAFKDAVKNLLQTNIPSALTYYRRGRKVFRDSDPYLPYQGLPDTLRNRLMMFIARWSPEYLEFEQGKADIEPKPALLLDDRSLVKWETSAPDNPQGCEILRIARKLVSVANDGEFPTVLDPFAGGGAIPLETQRLGGKAVANDYNPVAHTVLRATCEYPQKYGKPGKRTVHDPITGEHEEGVPNVLVHDISHWANLILERTRTKLADLYPVGNDGLPVITYLWARTVPCANPSCRATVPLLRSLLVAKKDGKQVALDMKPDPVTRGITFGIVKGAAITRTDGTKRERGPAICPVCNQPTTEQQIRQAGVNGTMSERMVGAVVQEADGKGYRAVETADLVAYQQAAALASTIERPGEYIVPEINAPSAGPNAGAHRSINLELYGFKQWGQLFNPRQLLVIQTLIEALHEMAGEMDEQDYAPEYRDAIATYTMGVRESRSSRS